MSSPDKSFLSTFLEPGYPEISIEMAGYPTARDLKRIIDAIPDNVMFKSIGIMFKDGHSKTTMHFFNEQEPPGQWYDVGSLSCRCGKCGCKNEKPEPICPHCGSRMEMMIE